MALVDQLSSLFHNLRKPIAATGLAVKTSASQAATSAPTLTSGSGAPSASEPDGSVYMRTGGTSILTSFYVRVSSAWVAVADFGTVGITTDVIAEKTAATGVTVDGLRIMDATVKPVAGGTAVLDLSACATGEGDVLVADNLASAFAIREAATDYLVVCSTNSAESISSKVRLSTTDGVASGIERVVGGRVYCSVAASAAITGATETETLFDSQISLPANTLKAGTVVRVRAQGIHTATTGSEDHSMILKIGSVAVTTMAAIDPANSDLWYFDAIIVCRTAGAGGTIVATGTQLAQAATGVGTAKPFLLASTTLDTTGANIVGVAIDRQGTATDSDSARLDVMFVEVIG
jgi:hypothetical protein